MREGERERERQEGAKKGGEKEQEGTGVNRSIFDIGKKQLTKTDRQTESDGAGDINSGSLFG